MAQNLIEGLHSEMNRVREMINIYNELPNNAGVFASMMMKSQIKKAESAISNGDTIEMLRAYQELKDNEL